MGWGTDRFFAAFQKHGMVDQAYYWEPSLAASVPFSLDLMAPQEDMLGEVRDFDYLAEYESNAVAIRRKGYVAVGAQLFSVNRPPKAVENGAFSQITLTKQANISPSFDPTVTPWDLNGADFVSVLPERPE